MIFHNLVRCFIIIAIFYSFSAKAEQVNISTVKFNDMYTQKVWRLSDFAGKVIVVNFWATWCGPCLKELPQLLTLTQTHKENIILLEISTDTTITAPKTYVKRFKRNYKHLKEVAESDSVIWISDKNKNLAQNIFKIKAVPETFIFNGNGKLVGHVSGAGEKEYEKIKGLVLHHLQYGKM